LESDVESDARIKIASGHVSQPPERKNPGAITVPGFSNEDDGERERSLAVFTVEQVA
jgi:hypothetical protein